MEKGDVEELVKALTRPNHTMSRENVAQLLENWNKGKMPREPKTQKIVIRKPGIGQSKDLSIPQARKAPEIAEGVVKTRSVTAVAPTMGASTISTIPSSRLQELMTEESKRPYTNVSYLNVAKRTWIVGVPYPPGRTEAEFYTVIPVAATARGPRQGRVL